MYNAAQVISAAASEVPTGVIVVSYTDEDDTVRAGLDYTIVDMMPSVIDSDVWELHYTEQNGATGVLILDAKIQVQHLTLEFSVQLRAQQLAAHLLQNAPSMPKSWEISSAGIIVISVATDDEVHAWADYLAVKPFYPEEIPGWPTRLCASNLAVYVCGPVVSTDR